MGGIPSWNPVPPQTSQIVLRSPFRPSPSHLPHFAIAAGLPPAQADSKAHTLIDAHMQPLSVRPEAYAEQTRRRHPGERLTVVCATSKAFPADKRLSAMVWAVHDLAGRLAIQAGLCPHALCRRFTLSTLQRDQGIGRLRPPSLKWMEPFLHHPAMSS